MPTGINAYGAYIPNLRMSRKAIAEAHAWSTPSLRGLGKGSRSFCSWDEDPITMAVEALRACRNTKQSKNTQSLVFASTSAPFDDLQNASTVAIAAGLPTDLMVQDTGGSLRAGLSALISSLNSSNKGDAYVVAADNRHTKPGSVQEMHYGVGAAAVGIGRGKSVIAETLGSYSEVNQFVDHHRASTQKYDYYWEERWIRDEGYMKIVPQTVNKLLKKCKRDAQSINYFCLPGYQARVATGVAAKLGINPEAVVDNFAKNIGDTGTPQPLLMLIAALEQAKPGDTILVIGFGAGCDALLLEVTDEIISYRKNRDGKDNVASLFDTTLSESTHYNQLLAFSGEIKLDSGIRSETDNRVALTQLYRAQDQLTGFNAGVCPNCKTVQFPILGSCISCGSTESMTLKSLQGEAAQVATFSSDYLQYYPAPPMYWGLVQFDNGARLLMEMVNVDADNFDVGTGLKMVYRIKQKDEQRGLHRYFWKATPANRSN